MNNKTESQILADLYIELANAGESGHFEYFDLNNGWGKSYSSPTIQSNLKNWRVVDPKIPMIKYLILDDRGECDYTFNSVEAADKYVGSNHGYRVVKFAEVIDD